MMVDQIKIDPKIKLRVGDVVAITEYGAQNYPYGQQGDRAEVINIDLNKSRISRSSIYLRRDTSHPNWSDAGGNTPPGKGVVISVSEFMEVYERCEIEMVVSKHIIHRGRDLIGMPCRTIVRSGRMFGVQFKEDIGGCSCDGLGKRGYCLLVNNNCLKEKLEVEEEKKALLFKKF